MGISCVFEFLFLYFHPFCCYMSAILYLESVTQYYLFVLVYQMRKFSHFHIYDTRTLPDSLLYIFSHYIQVGLA